MEREQLVICFVFFTSYVSRRLLDGGNHRREADHQMWRMKEGREEVEVEEGEESEHSKEGIVGAGNVLKVSLWDRRTMDS